MQAFWVRTLIDNNSLTFNNAMRYHANPTVNSVIIPTTGMKAPKQDIQQILRLQVSSETSSDETVIYFNPKASNDLDAYDSPKWSNANKEIPEIYTLAGNEPLVINGLKSFEPNNILMLGFTTGQANTFTIKATQISNFDPSVKIFIKDNVLALEQELTENSAYSFASEASSTTTRFSLIFKTVGTVTGIDTNPYTNLLIYKNSNNLITIDCKDQIWNESLVCVYNVMGQKLLTKKLTGSITVIDNQLRPGIYVVEVKSDGKHSTQKITID